MPLSKLAYRRRGSGRRKAFRGLELKCVPQRACNGSARGPALETRDPGKLSIGRAAAAPRNASRAREAWRSVEANQRMPITVRFLDRSRKAF